MTRLPPYGKRIRDIVHNPSLWRDCPGTSADGKHLSVWIAVGAESWQWAQEHARLLLLAVPPEEDPAALDFTFLRGHDPILVTQAGAVTGEFVKDLVAALIRDGVQRVLFCGENGSTLYRTQAHA